MTKTYPSIGYLTDPGQERTENQDNLVVRELDWGTLLLVADGMGGHQDGSLASKIAVDVITDILADAHPDLSQPTAIQGILWEAIVQANQAIWSRANQGGGTNNMGTTVVLAVVIRGKAYVAHVGDSRLYHIGQGLPAQITMDHTTVQAMVDHGIITMAQSKVHPDANKLAKALGVRESVEPEVRAGPLLLESGDVLMLCSDGLYDVVTDDTIADIVSRFPSEAAAKQLVQIANDAGGPDNISVIVYQHGKPKVRRSMTRAMPAQTGRRGPLGLPLWTWLLTGVLVLALIGTGLALWAPWAEPDEEPPKKPAQQKEQPEKTKPPKNERPGQGRLTEEPPAPAKDEDVKPEPEPVKPTPEPTPVSPNDGRLPGPEGSVKIGPDETPDLGTKPKNLQRSTTQKSKKKRRKDAKACASESVDVKHGRQVAQFNALLKTVAMYIDAHDGQKANEHYRKAKNLHAKLPSQVKDNCQAKLDDAKDKLKSEFLLYAKENADKNECRAARGRADEAMNLFGATKKEADDALGSCKKSTGTLKYRDLGTTLGVKKPTEAETTSTSSADPSASLEAKPGTAEAKLSDEAKASSTVVPPEDNAPAPAANDGKTGDGKGTQGDVPKENSTKDAIKL